MDKNYIYSLAEVFQQVYILSEATPLMKVCCQKIIEGLAEEAGKGQHTIEERLEKVENGLKECIVRHLSVYRKDEINAGLVCLKAFFKVKISDTHTEKDDFEYSMRLEEILTLLLLENESGTGGEDSIFTNSTDMMFSFRLAYHYCVLHDNMEHYALQKEEYSSLLERDLGAIFKEGFFYSGEYSDHMDSLLFMNLYEVPEDSRIQTPEIGEWLRQKKLTMEDIRRAQGDVIKSYLGFSFEDLALFSRFLVQHQINGVFFLMGEKETINGVDRAYGIGAAAERIIDYFAMDFPLINSVKKVDRVRLLELKSILRTDGSLLAYTEEFLFNINCFEKMVLKRHFVNYLTAGMETQQKEAFLKGLNKNEEKTSSFLAYVLLDRFHVNGYAVPKSGKVPLAEIKSIIQTAEDKQQTNILKDKGDIDVLAADRKKKEIYNIEMKYYQPMENLREMYSIDKEGERKKNLVLPLRRGQILYDNMETVLRFLGLDSDEAGKYRVRTIFVTPRADYWLKKEHPGVEYYDWVELLDGIGKKSL